MTPSLYCEAVAFGLVSFSVTLPADVGFAVLLDASVTGFAAGCAIGTATGGSAATAIAGSGVNEKPKRPRVPIAFCAPLPVVYAPGVAGSPSAGSPLTGSASPNSSPA